MLLLSLPFWLIAWLMRDTSGSTPDFGPMIFPASPRRPSLADFSWWEILRSLLFWAVTLGLVTYVVYRYARDHPELWEALMSFGPIRALYELWMALWRRLGRWTQAVRKRLPRGLARRRARRGRESTARFPWPRARSPREWVLHYYLNALRQADKEGYPRRAPQTPLEYGEVLKPNLPDAQQEMDLLTQAFVEARYSQHSIAPDRVGRVRATWRRVIEALRSLRAR
jgi:hypothetical protein